MRIGILGTSTVGQAHAVKLAALGHEVSFGTRNIAKKLASPNLEAPGSPTFADWLKGLDSAELLSYGKAAGNSEIVFNALRGEASLPLLSKLKEELAGKILVDIANPLDFSKGMPPSLFVSNTDSLGEQIQRALPETKVVKAFNAVTARLQADPGILADGDHHLFICGNDASAKAAVTGIAESYGWKNIMDLGDITNARAIEMIMPIWLRIWGTIKDPLFNFKVVTEK